MKILIMISLSLSLAGCVSNSVNDTQWLRDGQTVSIADLNSVKEQCEYKPKYNRAASLRNTSLKGGRYNSSNAIVSNDEYIQEATKLITEVKACMNAKGLSAKEIT